MTSDAAGRAGHSSLETAIQNIRTGGYGEAVLQLKALLAAGRSDVQLWLAMAYACHGVGDSRGKLEALDRVLMLDERHVPALIMKGDHLRGAGDERSASAFYKSALRHAPPDERLPPELKRELARVDALQAQIASRFDAHLAKGLAEQGFEPGRSSSRFALSLDLMAGRKTHYVQQPRYYFLPGLADIQFYPREMFPWMDAVEAATDDICAELQGVMQDQEAFAPYVEDRANRPRHAQRGMLGNADWSAFFLVRDGEPVPENIARCPKTMAALTDAPLTGIARRSPSILFSKLAPGARIPPHHGMVNTRLICHLPLIVPPGCALRVGNETRAWERGKVWAFDDTIEHEAWNTSDETRVILLFDVWKPELTAEERSLVHALFQTIDAYGAPVQPFGT
jgi:hypothetical protein